MSYRAPSTRFALAAGVLAATAGLLPAQFFPHTQYTSQPLAGESFTVCSAAAIDANGDMYPDLVVSEATQGRLAILINDGQNPPGFSQQVLTATGVSFQSVNSSGRRPLVKVADFDADGDEDVLRHEPDSGEVEWILNDGWASNPLGYVQGTTDLSVLTGVTGLRIRAMEAIELDGTPGSEFVVGWNDNSVDIFEVIWVNGSPIFALLHKVDGPTPNTILIAENWGLAVGDIDGDGDDDIARAHYGIFLNETTFPGGAPSYSFTTYATSGGSGAARGVAIGDITGSGSADIVTARTPTPSSVNDLNVRLGEATQCGTTSFGIASNSPINLYNGFTYVVQLADLDDDGLDDAMLSYDANASGNLSVMRSNGDGTFTDRIDLQSGALGGNPSTREAVAADFDQDGDVDIVGFTTAYALQLFVNASPKVFPEIFTDYPQAVNSIWVDDDADPVPADGSYTNPFPSINDALLLATAGDAILVRPGFYDCTTEGTPTLVLDGIQLIGVAGPDHTQISQVPIQLSNGARVSGFKLTTTADFATFLIEITDGTCSVVGNVFFGGGSNSMDAIRVGLDACANIGSNIVHDFDDAIFVSGGTNSLVTIRNNTLVGNRSGIYYYRVAEMTIRDNLIVDNSTHGVHFFCSGPSATPYDLDIDRNWVADNGDDWSAAVPFPNNTCGSDVPAAGTNTVTDPWSMSHFVDADGNDFHLNDGISPAIDRGTRSNYYPQPEWLGIDVDGDARSIYSDLTTTQTSLFRRDIGADEYSPHKLELVTTPLNFQLTASTPALALEVTLISYGPAITDLQFWPFLSETLVNLFPPQFIGYFTPGLPGTPHLLPRTLGLPLDERFYFQSAVFYAFAGEANAMMTNPIVVTWR